MSSSGSIETDVAAWLLTALGARRAVPDAPPPDAPPPDTVVLGADGPDSGRPASALLVSDGLPAELPGVPEATVAYAVGVALAAGALAAVLAGAPVEVRAVDVALQLFLPQVMAGAYGSPTWPAPADPVALERGGGWLSCELGAPGDRERFELLRSTLPREVGAGDLARAAQEWRLAVCDYRPRPGGGGESVQDGSLVGEAAPVRFPPAVSGADSATGRAGPGPLPRASRRPAGAPGPPLAGITVCDLTAMWAGPLCTWLLGRLGATVWKVEPAVRPDGMRAFDGSGVHPGGRSSAPGSDSGLFHALNSGKQRAPWDLRDPAQRRRFEELVQMSDVVVDSFSPRVMPNFGLTPEVLTAGSRAPITLSLPAFPPGPMRDWVAYGTGVHAVSGLGALGPRGSSGVPYAAPSVTYPDPVAGLTAAAAVLAGLVGRRSGWRPAPMEVALQSAVLPLLRLGGPSGTVAERDPGLGLALLEAAGPDAVMGLEVSGHVLAHPVGPFRGPVVALPPDPAPAWRECRG